MITAKDFVDRSREQNELFAEIQRQLKIQLTNLSKSQKDFCIHLDGDFFWNEELECYDDPNDVTSEVAGIWMELGFIILDVSGPHDSKDGMRDIFTFKLTWMFL